MHRHSLLPFLLLLLAAALALATPAAAQTGRTSIALGGKSVRSLKAQGVTIAAKRPARIVKGTLRLPVTGGFVSGSATLNQGGSLILRRKDGGKRRSIAFSRIQVRLGTKSSIVGTVGRKRYAVFSLAGKGASLNGVNGSASLRGAKVTLTAKAARAIKSKLGLKRLPAAAFGKAAVDALVTGTGGGAGGGAGGGGTGGGGAGGGPPTPGEIDDAPTPFPRPATAVDLSGATVKWTLRDSWVRYVSTQKPIATIDGAIPDPAIQGKDHPCPTVPADPGPLVYTYTLPFASGWHDPVSGATSITTTGGLHFSYPAHGIDFSIQSLDIELNASASRAIGLFKGGSVTDPAGKRSVAIDLAAPPLPAPGGPTQVLARVPQGGGESAFAGFYAPGEGFGCISVTY